MNREKCLGATEYELLILVISYISVIPSDTSRNLIENKTYTKENFQIRISIYT